MGGLLWWISVVVRSWSKKLLGFRCFYTRIWGGTNFSRNFQWESLSQLLVWPSRTPLSGRGRQIVGLRKMHVNVTVCSVRNQIDSHAVNYVSNPFKCDIYPKSLLWFSQEDLFLAGAIIGSHQSSGIRFVNCIDRNNSRRTRTTHAVQRSCLFRISLPDDPFFKQSCSSHALFRFQQLVRVSRSTDLRDSPLDPRRSCWWDTFFDCCTYGFPRQVILISR